MSLNAETLKIIIKHGGFLIINLALVYFLEYTITTCYADRITNQIKSKNPSKQGSYLYENLYTMFALSYQIGVFISRSSLSLIRIPRVEILTIL
mmetsp:Transcript_958/g.968  ORF Transcript_958/g.968 Transcript_958/m.968 type:complete len:94 (+) Transcript_958:220-501(+)